MCVHPQVSSLAERNKIDEACRRLTAPWVRNQHLKVTEASGRGEVEIEAPPTTHLCSFYENLDQMGASSILPPGVYTLEDLKLLGSKANRTFCPYFASRRLIQVANVVVLNYQYIIDPKVSQVALLNKTVSPIKNTFNSNETSRGSFNSVYHPDLTAPTEPSIVVCDEAHNIDNVCSEGLSVNLNRQTLD
eukprot:Platyproteum_vivax@DN11260_c0_g1_i1.p1